MYANLSISFQVSWLEKKIGCLSIGDVILKVLEKICLFLTTPKHNKHIVCLFIRKDTSNAAVTRNTGLIRSDIYCLFLYKAYQWEKNGHRDCSPWAHRELTVTKMVTASRDWAVTWAVIELWPSRDWAVITLKMPWLSCDLAETGLWPSLDWAMTSPWLSCDFS